MLNQLCEVIECTQRPTTAAWYGHRSPTGGRAGSASHIVEGLCDIGHRHVTEPNSPVEFKDQCACGRRLIRLITRLLPRQLEHRGNVRNVRVVTNVSYNFGSGWTKSPRCRKDKASWPGIRKRSARMRAKPPGLFKQHLVSLPAFGELYGVAKLAFVQV